MLKVMQNILCGHDAFVGHCSSSAITLARLAHLSVQMNGQTVNDLLGASRLTSVVCPVPQLHFQTADEHLVDSR